MKILFNLVLNTFLCFNILGQAQESDRPIAVEKISLARDDGNGKPGATATDFIITDIPIHCLIQLNSARPVTVKMNLVVVKATGFKAGTTVVVVSYKTRESQNRVSFNASPNGIWSAGKYRVDISLDNKLVRSLDFTIRKSTLESDKADESKSNPNRGKNLRPARKN